jgi:hypothetical protein
MATPLSPPEQGQDTAPQEGRRITRLMLGGLAGLFVLALVLWARYGSAVFLETMANAWAYCF